MSPAEWIGVLGGAGVFGVGGNFAAGWVRMWFKSADAEVRREEHRDGLTFELLDAARIELAALRMEVSRLRPLENHLLHMEEALAYIDSLLHATSADRASIERQARAFVNRMRRMREAIGTLSNEVQRVESGVEIVRRVTGEEPH